MINRGVETLSGKDQLSASWVLMIKTGRASGLLIALSKGGGAAIDERKGLRAERKASGQHMRMGAGEGVGLAIVDGTEGLERVRPDARSAAHCGYGAFEIVAGDPFEAVASDIADRLVGHCALIDVTIGPTRELDKTEAFGGMTKDDDMPVPAMGAGAVLANGEVTERAFGFAKAFEEALKMIKLKGAGVVGIGEGEEAPDAAVGGSFEAHAAYPGLFATDAAGQAGVAGAVDLHA